MQHRAWIMALAFSPDGRTILTGSSDRTARLWDAATGMPIGPPLVHRDKLATVAFSPDGKAILTGCNDGKARLFPTVPEFPEDLARIGVWTEVLTGLTLDAHGSVQVPAGCAAWAIATRAAQATGRPASSRTGEMMLDR